MLNKVLIATDGSANAQRSVELGSGIAACFGAGVTIVHVEVAEPSDRELSGMGALWDEVGPQPFGVLHMDELVERLGSTPGWEHANTRTGAMHEIGNRVLQHARSAASDAGIRDPETRLLHGDPGEVIAEAARAEEADLVVMGSRGLGQVRGALLGSVSQKVASHVAASCLTVR
ncbi:MAG: universal stress protein [Halofilum sp. (in: g-proteobacteria)]|nr:universal stress protein [Halofilum sp. (in: g-proteobacteria)]